MNHQKNKEFTQCVSQLRGFIDEARALNSKKGVALLALDQLHRITAGSDNSQTSGGGCLARPRVDGNS